MAGAEFDFSEMEALARDLVAAGRNIVKESRVVLQQHAIRTKQGMAADSAGHRMLGGVPAGVTYDTRETANGAEAEIGWRPGKGQSSLAWIGANGTSRRGPLFDHTAAQGRELPATERFLADLGVRLLE